VLLGVGLLLDVVLGTALPRLARFVLLLILGLGVAVARKARDGSTDSASEAVGRARGKVAELSAGFLLLARQVLLAARLLQRLDRVVSASVRGRGAAALPSPRSQRIRREPPLRIRRSGPTTPPSDRGCLESQHQWTRPRIRAP